MVLAYRITQVSESDLISYRPPSLEDVDLREAYLLRRSLSLSLVGRA